MRICYLILLLAVVAAPGCLEPVDAGDPGVGASGRDPGGHVVGESADPDAGSAGGAPTATLAPDAGLQPLPGPAVDAGGPSPDVDAVADGDPDAGGAPAEPPEPERRCWPGLPLARLADDEPWARYPSRAERLVTTPLQTVELCGAGEGERVSYVWRILERPPGSRSELEQVSGSSARALLLDTAGGYVLSLAEADSPGGGPEDDLLVVIDAIPTQDLYVELVWASPDDPDPSDEGFAAGPDLDLHLLHPLGTWFGHPHDCFYGNPHPDWASPAKEDDDPALLLDSTTGHLPEVIAFDAPEHNRTYGVGAHYFSDHGFAASFATLRVFVHGALRFELANRRLPATDAFWEVVDIPWPGGEPWVIDQVWATPPVGEGR